MGRSNSFAAFGDLESLDRGEFERARRAFDTLFYTSNPDEIVVKAIEGTDDPPLSSREVFLRLPKRLIVHALLNVLFAIEFTTEGAKLDLKVRREHEAADRDALMRALTKHLEDS